MHGSGRMMSLSFGPLAQTNQGGRLRRFRPRHATADLRVSLETVAAEQAGERGATSSRVSLRGVTGRRDGHSIPYLRRSPLAGGALLPTRERFDPLPPTRMALASPGGRAARPGIPRPPPF